MEVVLVDKFIVSEESKAELLKAAHESASFLRTLPGFVEGFIYEKSDGGTRYNVMTTAVWENDEAYENAKKAVATEFKKRGFHPQEIMARLKVEIERAVYRRSPY
jgi:heme-degrading monooxygenase HmoA